MGAVQHDQRRAQQIDTERTRREPLDLAFIGGRAEHEAADHQQCGEDKSGDHMERVRPDHRRPALQAGEGPEQREHDGGDREPAPQPDPRQPERRRGDDGEVDIQRPEIRLAGRNQNRRSEGGGDAEAGQRRPVQQRRGERAQRHHAEQDERGGGRQKIVQRIGGVDGCESHGGPGGGEDCGNVGDRQRLDRRNAFLAPGPFAGSQQRQRERAAEHDAHAGAEQPGLDRIAHHEETAERQRQAADPDHPAGADPLLEAGPGLRKRRGRGDFRGCRRSRCGLDRRRLCFRCFVFSIFSVADGAIGVSCAGSGGGAAAAWRRYFQCIEPCAQHGDLIEGLAREDERDDGNHQRKKVERKIKHQASRRSARRRGLPH